MRNKALSVLAGTVGPPRRGERHRGDENEADENGAAENGAVDETDLKARIGAIVVAVDNLS